ncbi:MAG: hypothetical protein JW829_17525 [Pirellulales bacterium]|nr:hypothetical protein [Pirellulales bacterium]
MDLTYRGVRDARFKFDDMFSEISKLERDFIEGKVTKVQDAFQSLSTKFDQRVTQWRMQFRQNPPKNPKERRDDAREQQHGNARVQPVTEHFMNMKLALQKLEKGAQEHSTGSDQPKESAAELPAGFLREFMNAGKNPAEKRAAVLKYFVHEKKLELHVVEGKKPVVRPGPAYNRFYFLAATSQVIRIQRIEITDVIHIHDPAADKKRPMTLKEFAEHVQQGVWLLEEKPTHM